MPSTPAFPEAIRGRRICALIWCFNGAADEAAEILRAVEALPSPIFEDVRRRPFIDLQRFFDPLWLPGLQWYRKSDFVRELTDDAIDTDCANAAKFPSELSLMHLYPIDGAVQRVGRSETAWSHRDVTWSMVIAGVDPDPQNADRITTWAKEY